MCDQSEQSIDGTISQFQNNSLTHQFLCRQAMTFILYRFFNAYPPERYAKSSLKLVVKKVKRFEHFIKWRERKSLSNFSK